ncbi:hypothetical protein ACWEU6_08265 [Streptosporangium sandarakinum]|uniref:hypothetical protein n=1 Tax=Streptosporangium sandarakinum TaxID=1260955 RepID=UPI0036B53F38
MDDARIQLMRELLEGTEWAARTRGFARSLRTAGHSRGHLLIVGTPHDEPWHMTAHLEQESLLAGVPELAPTLVRHHVPIGAPPHLAVDLTRLEAAGRGETVFVLAPTPSGEQVLERIADARRSGAVVLALEDGDRELRGLAHEALTVAQGTQPLWPGPALRPDGVIIAPAAAFETAQHLVSLAAGETPAGAGSRRGFRDRLSRWLETLSGPAQVH